MTSLKITVTLLTVILCANGANIRGKKPPMGGSGRPGAQTSLGVVMPSLNGWGSGPAPTTTAAPGWSSSSSPAPGWSSSTPGSPSIEIEMVSQSEVYGEGEAGATHGSETTATGNATDPATATIITGSTSGLGQGSSNIQTSLINSAGESQTSHTLENYNFGDSGDFMSAALFGNNLNSVNGGASFVNGVGALGQLGYTINNNPGLGGGWVNGK